LDLREDGAAAVGLEGGDVEVVPPSGDLRPVGRGRQPAWAGDSVLVSRGAAHGEHRRLVVVDPAGTAAALGIPSRDLTQIEATPAAALWRSNGCALTEPLGAGGAATS